MLELQSRFDPFRRFSWAFAVEVWGDMVFR